jgi:TonB family protein
MRKAMLALLVVACASDPPPRTEAAPQSSASAPQSSASAAQSAKAEYDEQFSHGYIGLGNMGTGGHNIPPRAADAGPLANGRLAPEEVQRVVRSQFKAMRTCYERALVKTPALEGRVAVKFVIDPTGAVSSATSHPSTTMPDAAVVDCVLGVFKTMKFPAPAGGDVSVVYPFDFRPSD